MPCSIERVIDRDIKRCLGQMIKGIEVVGAAHGGISRAYTSHWVSQVSFEEPIVMASASPKHDTHALMAAAGEWSVSILAGDQIDGIRDQAGLGLDRQAPGNFLAMGGRCDQNRTR